MKFGTLFLSLSLSVLYNFFNTKQEFINYNIFRWSCCAVWNIIARYATFL